MGGGLGGAGGSPGRAGLQVTLLESGLGFDVLRVVMAVLVHHHAAGAHVEALGRGQLVPFKVKDASATSQTLAGPSPAPSPPSYPPHR